MKDIKVPIDFAEWKLTNPSPQEQIDYFSKHSETRMPHIMWKDFYCESLQHKGFCCGSCKSDEEYFGVPNFDDECCCEANNIKEKVGK